MHFRPAVLLALALPLALSCTRASDGPPNIVLIVADDQDYEDFGFMGSDFIHTPNLDSLAREGIVFTHGYNTAASCRPSLRTLLTGLHPIQLDVMQEAIRARGARFADIRMMSKIETLPRRLAEVGYASFQGGKYWEGDYTVSGFSEGTATGVSDELIEEEGVIGALSGGAGNALGRTTMKPLFDFIDEHVDQPFFVFFAPMLPHLPHNPSPRHKRYYPQKDFSRAQRNYYGNVTRLDARIGELIAHLDERGLRERTVVIFLSDNGWVAARPGEAEVKGLGGSRGKMSIYERGFRTPIVVNAPGRLAGGRVDSRLVSTVDLYPTILELASATSESTAQTGASLVPVLRGQDQPARQHLIGRVVKLRVDGSKAIGMAAVTRPEQAYFLRSPDWRYVWYNERGEEELYAIESDPWEQTNVVDAHPDLARDFRREIETWIAQMTAPPAK